MMRVDVPKVGDNPGYTKFFGGGAIYAITPTTEEIAQIAAQVWMCDQLVNGLFRIRLSFRQAMRMIMNKKIIKTRMNSMNDEDTIACTICGNQTPMLGTKLCDRCWELQSRIGAAPELALQILTELNKTPLPPRRPATKIEVEAMQSICNMQDKLNEAWIIIRALLGAPPPRTWAKWPNIHKQATEFLRQHKSELQEMQRIGNCMI